MPTPQKQLTDARKAKGWARVEVWLNPQQLAALDRIGPTRIEAVRKIINERG